MKLLLLLLVLAVAVVAASAAIIEPRPVDNRRDPHDGEPFEWEPVDDDPWPGPSFTFPRLPGIDEVGALAGPRPPTLADARLRAALLMQLLQAIFNNNGANRNAANKPVSSNEVVSGSRPHRQQQKSDKRGGRNRPAQ